MVIENKPGAGATIGSELVAKAPPDGYTLLLASQTNAISATLYTKLNFQPIDDFVAISLLGREPGVLVVHPSLPVQERGRAGRLRQGAAGPDQLRVVGQRQRPAPVHGACSPAWPASSSTHVPYRGSGQATTDLLGGIGADVDARARPAW